MEPVDGASNGTSGWSKQWNQRMEHALEQNQWMEPEDGASDRTSRWNQRWDQQTQPAGGTSGHNQRTEPVEGTSQNQQMEPAEGTYFPTFVVAVDMSRAIMKGADKFFLSERPQRTIAQPAD